MSKCLNGIHELTSGVVCEKGGTKMGSRKQISSSLTWGQSIASFSNY